MDMIAESSGKEMPQRHVTIRGIRPDDNLIPIVELSLKAMKSQGFPPPAEEAHPEYKDIYSFYKEKGQGDFFLAEVDGRLVGCGGFTRHSNVNLKNTCQLRGLRVDPDFQNQGLGIGQRLLTDLENEATSRGYKTAFIDTSNWSPKMFHLIQKNKYQMREINRWPKNSPGQDYIEYIFEKQLQQPAPNK